MIVYKCDKCGKEADPVYVLRVFDDLESVDDPKQGATVQLCFQCAMGLHHWISNKMPTADVREVVHGKWRKVYPAYELNIVAREHEPCYVCSKCNAHVDVKTPFCPNCGADMRGAE